MCMVHQNTAHAITRACAPPHLPRHLPAGPAVLHEVGPRSAHGHLEAVGQRAGQRVRQHEHDAQPGDLRDGNSYRLLFVGRAGGGQCGRQQHVDTHQRHQVKILPLDLALRDLCLESGAVD